MTLETCSSFCAAANNGHGFQYYGLEYATQCYCGNTINPPAVKLNVTTSPSNNTCSTRCGGNNPEICGGSSVISLYIAPGFVPPVVKPFIGRYIAKGCLTDPNTSGRALQGASMTSPSMTEELCVKYCLGKSFHYSG